MKLWERLQTIDRFTCKDMLSLLLFILIGFLLSALASLILTLFQMQSNGKMVEQTFQQQNFGNLMILLLLPPIIEELLFRHAFFQVVLKNILHLPFGIAAGVSSLLFGMMHQPIAAALLAMVFGIVLCIVYERSGKLRYSICMHLGFNLFSFCVLLLPMG